MGLVRSKQFAKLLNFDSASFQNLTIDEGGTLDIPNGSISVTGSLGVVGQSDFYDGDDPDYEAVIVHGRIMVASGSASGSMGEETVLPFIDVVTQTGSVSLGDDGVIDSGTF